MWDYTEKVKDHFLNPRNVGEIKDPDAVGEVGNIVCGDALKLFLKIGKDGRIADAKFRTFGCASAIASSSALTEIIKGMTVEEAQKVTNDDIVRYLGGLPDEKMHCSVMGRDALEAAIADYRGQKVEKKPLAHDHEGTIVCKCFGITDEQIKRVVKENNLHTVEDVTHYTKAGGGCKSCHEDIEKLIQEAREEAFGEGKPEPKRPTMSNIKKINLIQDTFDKDIRPMLQHDGGDIELVDVEGDKVLVSFRGACVNCPMSAVTIKNLVESRLREYVSPAIVVEEVEE
jgi:NifU-like protein